jgi:hypothetical protein
MSEGPSRFATPIRFAPFTTLAGAKVWASIAAIAYYGEQDTPVKGGGARVSFTNGTELLVKETEAQITAMLKNALPSASRKARG